MNVIDTLTQRNEAFANSRFSAELKIRPSLKTMIIGCVDPFDIFGLAPGEAAVSAMSAVALPRQHSRRHWSIPREVHQRSLAHFERQERFHEFGAALAVKLPMAISLVVGTAKAGSGGAADGLTEPVWRLDSSPL
jgi:hypothetical protein